MLTQTREKFRGVLTVAQNLHQQNPDWVTFFREVLGIKGVVRQAFPNAEALAEFESSPEYEEIQKMLTKLRERRATQEKESETTRVITVRIPKSMHESLLSEAKDRRTSMNKLCISKLLQVVDEQLVPTPPTSTSRRRKRRQAVRTAASRNSDGAGAGQHVKQLKNAEEDL